MSAKKRLSHAGSNQNQSNTLIPIVIDVSPLAWGERDVKRTALDRRRKAEGKSSIGPAVLEEVLDAVLAFCNAIYSVERDAAIIVIGVADNATAVVFPRKNNLAQWMRGSCAPNVRTLKHDLTTGVAELVARAVKQHALNPIENAASRQAAMAAAFSTALCLINRLLLAARAGGVSALPSHHYMDRSDDMGIVAMMDPKDANSKNSDGPISAWAPRILLIQASEDRARDYNAFMNCAFCAIKSKVVVDACFLSAASSPKDTQFSSSSSFLEQACDLTGGVFLAPSGMAQIGGALTEVLLSVFLSPLACRSSLHLPALNKVDFRARCFESSSIVDIAYCCNQCLSIFRQKPNGHCPTCQALITVDNVERK